MTDHETEILEKDFYSKTSDHTSDSEKMAPIVQISANQPKVILTPLVDHGENNMSVEEITSSINSDNMSINSLDESMRTLSLNEEAPPIPQVKFNGKGPLGGIVSQTEGEDGQPLKWKRPNGAGLPVENDEGLELSPNYIQQIPTTFNFAGIPCDQNQPYDAEAEKLDSTEIKKMLEDTMNLMGEQHQSDSLKQFIEDVASPHSNPSPYSYHDPDSVSSDISTVCNVIIGSPDSQYSNTNSSSNHYQNNGYNQRSPGLSTDDNSRLSCMSDNGMLMNTDPNLNHSALSPESGFSEADYKEEREKQKIFLELKNEAEAVLFGSQSERLVEKLALQKHLHKKLESQKVPVQAINPRTMSPVEIGNKPRATVSPIITNNSSQSGDSKANMPNLLPDLPQLNIGDENSSAVNLDVTSPDQKDLKPPTSVDEKPKKKRGRPKGAKNKPKPDIPNARTTTYVILPDPSIISSITRSNFVPIQPKPAITTTSNGSQMPIILPKPIIKSEAPLMPTGNIQIQMAPTCNTKEVDHPDKEKKMMNKAHCQVSQITKEKLMRVDGDGDTLLTIGVLKQRYMFLALLERMEREGILTDYINKSNTMNQSPLYLAVVTNKPELVGVLLQKGANPNSWTRVSKDSWVHNQVIHVAASRGRDYLPILNILLNFMKSKNFNINEPNTEQKTVLHLAVEHHGKKSAETNQPIDSLKTIELLLLHGAEVKTGPNERTPLHSIAETLDIQLMRFFVDRLPPGQRKKAVNMKDSNQNTCLHIVCSLSNIMNGPIIYQLVHYLIFECEVDHTILNNNNETAKRLGSKKHESVLDLFAEADKHRKKVQQNMQKQNASSTIQSNTNLNYENTKPLYHIDTQYLENQDCVITNISRPQVGAVDNNIGIPNCDPNQLVYMRNANVSNHIPNQNGYMQNMPTQAQKMTMHSGMNPNNAGPIIVQSESFNNYMQTNPIATQPNVPMSNQFQSQQVMEENNRVQVGSTLQNTLDISNSIQTQAVSMQNGEIPYHSKQNYKYKTGSTNSQVSTFSDINVSPISLLQSLSSSNGMTMPNHQSLENTMQDQFINGHHPTAVNGHNVIHSDNSSYHLGNSLTSRYYNMQPKMTPKSVVFEEKKIEVKEEVEVKEE